MLTLLILCPLIGLAGFIDSIAGGGGIISITAYIACGLPGILAIGTNKFSAVVGTSAACANYIKTKNYDVASLIPAFIASLIGSKIGSILALKLNPEYFNYFLIVATPLILINTLTDKNYSNHEKDMSVLKRGLICFAISFAVGVYDGFYGPGTGTFLQMGFIIIAGISLKKACGNARITNFASNVGAITTFIASGCVVYKFAIPCAICSLIGNYLGSRFAINHDAKVIKPVMLTVVSLLFIKVLLDII